MMVVVTGGSGSGKSAFAEDQVLSLDPECKNRVYIATMHPFDEESKRRVERHRKMREGKQFQTVEQYTNVGSLNLPSDSTVLLECTSNLVANEMFEETGAGEQTVLKVLDDLAALKACVRNLVIVTNEIFSEAVTYEGDTLRYQSYLGEINQKMVQIADRAYEVVYGIPIALKGETSQ